MDRPLPAVHDTDTDRTGALSTDVWATMDRDARYLLRIHAAAFSRRCRPVLSHLSAARVWGLPILGPWPRAVHLRGGRRESDGDSDAIVWHRDYLPDADIVEVGGLLTTSRLRTMIDLARSQPFRSAVISLDAALQNPFVLPGGIVAPVISKERLLDRVGALGRERGTEGARSVARFADGRSGSRGESLSRSTMYLAHLPLPSLRAVYPHADGEDQVDFRWERRFHVRRQTMLGEFDWEVAHGRDRHRDARLRADDRVMVRWRWSDALDPARLRIVLARAGLVVNP